MFIRIRKEPLGYYLFDRDSRAQQFIEDTGQDFLSGNRAEILSLLQSYVPGFKPGTSYEILPPKNQDLSLSAPIGMYLEISGVCNMDCSHCYKHEPRTCIEPELEHYKALLTELREMGVFEIRICGNEPTTSPWLDEIVHHAKELNFYVGINTNAYFGKKTQDRLIALQPNFIAISVDGNKDTHDSIRRDGSYARAISFLERLGQTKIKRRINTVVSKQTASVIGHVAELADRFGSDVSYLPFRPVGKHADFNQENAIDSAIMHQVVQEIGNLRIAHPGITLLTYFDVLGEKATYHHSMDFNSPCPARKNGFIAFSGDFFPCDFLRFSGDTYFCGNVFEQGFETLWRNSTTLRGFQKLEHVKCKKSDHYMKKCYGGCISGAISSTGGPDDQLCFVRTESCC
ncbi:MAG: radical SAM protein [Candidatus Moraniibacteriota bacterium]